MASQKVVANGSSTKSQPPQNSLPRWLQTNNVYLFVPNLIGYARIVLASISLVYMPIHPLTCTILYGVSCILDALDGYAARKFSQSTKFGAVLDMVTDRCTTSCLLMFLSAAYPEHPGLKILFQFLLSLDLASHYMHMYAMMEKGAGSHKSVDREQSKILNLYYTNKTVLFTFCAANELHFVSLYLLSFPSPSAARDAILPFIKGMAYVTFPICFGKQIINFVQMARAAETLVNIDNESRHQARQLNGEKKE
ncbi:CDP-diacylglycerol-inositol 3-phosphatidyltransferase [Orbilia blumenaviensis]|uniref:CDP-diacylglycerol--inositol 3-phosphatidyltransferase n=1 Tax=Orbilia blumenaviensis TaxID=1796055 RepID=A0AAV9URE4_9PEZI